MLIRPKNIVADKVPDILPLDHCLAKTYMAGEKSVPGQTVENHCRIAGAVCQEFLQRLEGVWPNAKNIFPENIFMAPLLHDVGKICPTFQKKIHAAAGTDKDWPQLASVDAGLEKIWGKHSAVSYAAIKEIGGSEGLAEALGLHHGRPIVSKPGNCQHFGGDPWAEARTCLIKNLR